MSASFSHGQTDAKTRRDNFRQNRIERLENAKWGFIIYKLNLDEARANKLLPIYKAYEAEKKAIMQTSIQQFKGQKKDDMDDAQAEAFMNAKLETAQKMLDLKEKYKPKFLQVLSSKELLTLSGAEQDFAMKIMMERQKRLMERNK